MNKHKIVYIYIYITHFLTVICYVRVNLSPIGQVAANAGDLKKLHHLLKNEKRYKL